MPEPFKNKFNEALIESLAADLQRVDSIFDAAGFVAEASAGLEDLELKARSNQIAQALVTYLPDDFEVATQALIETLQPRDAEEGAPGQTGWVIMPMAEYVARAGLAHFDRAMQVLAEMTSRFSSEFAVRPFLAADLECGLAYHKVWAGSEDEHLRRLASEGARPYLPWGMHLPQIAQDPEPVIAILEMLKDDPSDYVRLSVANCLNDFSRDHPERVSALAGDWMKDASKARQKLIRHALRTLIKAGHPAALEVLGFRPPEIAAELSVEPGEITLGEALSVTAHVTSKSAQPQKLVVDFALHLRKKNGKLAPKVFKWTTLELGAGEVRVLKKAHAIKPVTTRVYYAGAQKLELLINGESFGLCDFELKI